VNFYACVDIPPVLVFPNCKPPLLSVAPGFCAWAIINKAGRGHQPLLVTEITAINKKWVSSFRLLVSTFTHTHAQHTTTAAFFFERPAKAKVQWRVEDKHPPLREQYSRSLLRYAVAPHIHKLHLLYYENLFPGNSNSHITCSIWSKKINPFRIF